jgi:hypothetical protein
MSGLQLGRHSEFAALKRRPFMLNTAAAVLYKWALNVFRRKRARGTREGSCSDVSPHWRFHLHFGVAVVSFYKIQHMICCVMI